MKATLHLDIQIKDGGTFTPALRTLLGGRELGPIQLFLGIESMRFCAQGLFLKGLRGPNMVPGIKPGSAVM